MTSIRVFFSRILDLLLRRQREERLSEELQAHLDFLTDEYVASGMSDDEARLAARRAFGGVHQVKMRYRDQRGLPSIDNALRDVRFAARLLAKDRRFTITAVVALALGIGVTNTVFTIINTAVFRDLPFDEPERLISLGTRGADGRDQGLSYADFLDWRRSTTAFTGLAASTTAPMNLSDEGRQPERLRGAYVSANTFRLLRRGPILGRDFIAEDERPGAPAVAIISYGVWQAIYGGDPAAIGRAVRINDVPSTIVGIMPARFNFPALQDVWQPLQLSPGIDSAKRDARRLSVFGRLADSADLPRARAEVETIAAQLARAYPETNNNIVASAVRMRDRLPQVPRPMMMALLGAVGFVLLIACANVANLLLARSVQRSREIAIRASLGATRWHIVRQLLVECVLIATVAGTLGLLLSVYGVKLLGVAFDAIDISAPGQSQTPYWVDLSMNAPVFLFVAALCLFTGLAFGLVPALHISRTDVNDTLKDGGRGGVGGRRAKRWTGAFVTIELALTVVLLTGAGLLWRSFLTNYQADRIIDASDLVTMRVGLPLEKYSTPDQQQQFYAQLDERLVARSDLFRATIASYIPYSVFLSTASQGSARQVWIDGHEPIEGETRPSVWYVFAGPRYFETIGMPLIRGRTFTAQDEHPAQEGAIVDQRFATTFFANEDPLGRRFQLSEAATQTGASPWLTIVGVVPTLVQYGPGRPANPVVYVPLRVEPSPRIAGLIARRSFSREHATGRRPPIGEDEQLAAIVSGVRDEVRALDSDLPVFAIETMDAALARSRVSNRLLGTWFGILAVIGLVLASVGLYAVTAHSVVSRRQEIGVRMALGAQATEVVWLFLRRSVVQLGIGLALGLGGALAIGQLLQGLFMETASRDPVTLIVVSAVLVTVSIVASWLPARRAARLDPVIALREE